MTEPGELLRRRVADLTTARVFTGRSGNSYRTAALLALRADHAAARDAVHADLDTGLMAELGLPVVDSQAADGAQHLRRPDLGRRLSTGARQLLLERCAPAADVQVVVGDGLSARAVSAQVPGLLPLLLNGVAERGWSAGTTFAVRHCRVGVLNEVGALLTPSAAVLLVGERPGLGTSDSLSAYVAWRPAPGHTDAERNLVAGIHQRGLGHQAAVDRVLDLLVAMRATGSSGVHLKEVEAPPALK